MPPQVNDLAEEIIDTVRHPMLVLDPGLRVTRANRAYYRLFRTDPEETIGRGVYELGNGQWDLPALHELLDEVLPDNDTFEDFEVEHDFETIGPRIMVLTGRRIAAKQLILLTIEDLTDERTAWRQVRDLNARLEQDVESGLAETRMLHEITRASNEAISSEEVLREALRIVCERTAWRAGHAWQLAEDGSGRMVSTGLWHSLAEWDLTRLQTASAGVRMGPGEGLIGRVIDSGEPVFVADIRRFPDWRRGAAEEFGVKTVIGVPVLINDEVLAVLEFLHSESVSHGSAVIKALGTIGRQIGLAVERHRLARLASERSEQERQIVGQELHDGLGQQIAALGMIATNLSRSLSEQGAPQSATAAKLVRGLDEAKTQVRALTKGLLPLEVETGGLTDALRDLVESARSAFRDVEFVLECDPRAVPEDRFAGNQLYRIAQEALHNATKHASPSRVSIRVSPADGRTRLEIRDDGKGLPDPLPPGGGSGLRIMRHRAGLIGGTLVIDSAPSGGTTVRCVAPAPDPRGRARSDAGS